MTIYNPLFLNKKPGDYLLQVDSEESLNIEIIAKLMGTFDKHFEGFRKHGADYVRRNFPEVQRIELMDELNKLKLTGATDLGDIIMMEYEAFAPSLFPYVRKSLIDKGIAKKHNILDIKRENRDGLHEKYRTRMGFYGSKLQIALTVTRFPVFADS